MIDKRTRYQCMSRFAIVTAFILWLTVIAIADSKPDYLEHAEGIMTFQFKVIATLLGIIQILVGFIYISGITSVKSSIRKLFEKLDHLEDKKLDKETHKELCEAKGSHER